MRIERLEKILKGKERVRISAHEMFILNGIAKVANMLQRGHNIEVDIDVNTCDDSDCADMKKVDLSELGSDSENLKYQIYKIKDKWLKNRKAESIHEIGVSYFELIRVGEYTFHREINEFNVKATGLKIEESGEDSKRRNFDCLIETQIEWSLLFDYLRKHAKCDLVDYPFLFIDENGEVYDSEMRSMEFSDFPTHWEFIEKLHRTITDGYFAFQQWIEEKKEAAEERRIQNSWAS